MALEEESLQGAVRLENRLTKIEAAVITTQGQLTVVEALVRTQNGRVADHMRNDETWMTGHALSHAEAKSYSKGVIAAVIATATLVGFLASTFSYPIARLIFG